MKTLTFTKANDLSQLHDELMDIPSLRPVPTDDPAPPYVGPEDWKPQRPVMSVDGIGDKIVLTVPDSADEKEIEKIVKAHIPKPLPPPPPTKKELKARLDKAKSVDEIKEIVGAVLERL